MLDFFRRLRREGRLVFLCVQEPERTVHLEILEEICERFIFVQSGRLTQAASFEELLGLLDPVQAYLAIF